MINVGIIGCGKIAQVRHLPEYANNENASIRAVYDLNADRCKEVAEKYGAVACSSIEEMLAMQEVDAVSVCTANHTHAEISIAALEAGKHVLCEKPMAIRLEDCIAMVAAAEQSGKTLMIGHNQRLAKGHVVARELIEKGEIGKILRFKTEFSHGGPETWSIDPGSGVWFFDKDKAVMGAMADLGIHKIDLIHFLTGQKTKSVMALLDTVDKKYADGQPIGVDDNALCILELEDGCVGTMAASWTNYGAECNATVLYGTEGVMHIYENPDHTIVLEKKSGETQTFDVEQIQTNDNQTASGVIDLFVQALVEDRQPDISGRVALDAMRAVFAAVESAETGRRIGI